MGNKTKNMTYFVFFLVLSYGQQLAKNHQGLTFQKYYKCIFLIHQNTAIFSFTSTLYYHKHNLTFSLTESSKLLSEAKDLSKYQTNSIQFLLGKHTIGCFKVLNKMIYALSCIGSPSPLSQENKSFNGSLAASAKLRQPQDCTNAELHP